jgi:uncharacterized protein YceH (UPF0502 family)
MIEALTAEETRVLGCLVEKQLTTPQQYPLTLNALTLACNQSSNRDPVVEYPERTVEEAMTSAKTKGLARFVHPSHGRSAIRYAHMLGEVFGIDTRQLALVAVLMLRGPQTPGELRARTERMAPFDDLADLERELEGLSRREEPLVAALARRPGQKEIRYCQLLSGASVQEHGTSSADVLVPASADTPEHVTAPGAREDGPWRERLSPATTDRGASSLEREVEELKAQVQAIRQDLEALRSQLGG